MTPRPRTSTTPTVNEHQRCFRGLGRAGFLEDGTLKKAYVPCTHCGGTGAVELTGVYAETLTLLFRFPGLNGAALARKAGCNATAMNNRLKRLEFKGVAVGKRFGRQITWKAK